MRHATLLALALGAMAIPAHAATVYAPNRSIYQPVSAVVTPAQVQSTKPRLVTHHDGRVELIPGQVVYTAPQVRVEKPLHHKSNAWQTTTEHTVYMGDGSSHTARTRTYHEPTDLRRSRPVYHQPVHHQPVYHHPVRHQPVHHRPACSQPVYTKPCRTPGYGYHKGHRHGYHEGYHDGYRDGRYSRRRYCRPIFPLGVGFHFRIGG